MMKTKHAPLRLGVSNESSSLLEERKDESRGQDGDGLLHANILKLVLIIAVLGIACFFRVSKSINFPVQEKIYPDVKFPSDFVWGSATSSFQIEGATNEGGRGRSIWDTFCDTTENCNGDNADIACDHYHRVDSDVRLMKRLGLKAYRFSISWPRIIPNGQGEVNPEGVAFYNYLINSLIENRIEPWVTLYHWDLPQSLEDKYGGWLGREVVDDFGHYASTCFELFGDRVKHWITINESWTVAVNGYSTGVHAPGRKEEPDIYPYIAGHHLILAHARAVSIYRTQFFASQRGAIGISNNGDYRYPLHDNEDDREAAERAIIFMLGWFCDPIFRGDYPEDMRARLGDRLPTFTTEELKEVYGSADFLGLNHYSSLMASKPQNAPTYAGYWADIFVDLSNNPKWETNTMGWGIVPDGCLQLLKWIQHRYNNPTVFITENGSSFDEPYLEVALHDYKRRDFFEEYIRKCGEAIRDGVNLQGYFAWSLMDNFEWQFGYSRRFGLCFVDFGGSLERTPKLSAKWYTDTIRSNGRNLNKIN